MYPELDVSIVILVALILVAIAMVYLNG